MPKPTPTGTQKGTLYIVATPIGNLADLSPRAREILGSASLILCEDTRHSSKLLSHAEIHVPLVSLHEHNEREKAEGLAARILTLDPPLAALVSDAGTPCISDPGAHFVRAARLAGLEIISVPGPSALTTAIAASGLAAPRHVFSAFLPRDRKGQQEEFRRWQAIAPCLGIFYESPQRLIDTLATLETVLAPETEISVSREISKIHEEHVAGPLSEVRSNFASRDRVQGECVVTVLVENCIPIKAALSANEALAAALKRVEQGERLKDVVKELAAENGLDAKDLYRDVVAARE